MLGQPLEVPQRLRTRASSTLRTRRRRGWWRSPSRSQAGFLQPNKCCFYEWDVHGKQAARNAFGVPDATFGMFHDCLVTENWYLLLQNPNKLDPQKLIGEYMFAKCALAEVIAFQEGQPAKLHMLPEDGQGAEDWPQKTIDVDNQFFFHHVNAFEPEGCDDASRW